MAGPVQEESENWRRLIAVNFLSPEHLACQGLSSRDPAGCRCLSPGQGGDTGRHHLPQQHHRPGEFTVPIPAPGRASRTRGPGAALDAHGRTRPSQSLWAAAAPSEHCLPQSPAPVSCRHRTQSLKEVCSLVLQRLQEALDPLLPQGRAFLQQSPPAPRVSVGRAPFLLQLLGHVSLIPLHLLSRPLLHVGVSGLLE